MSRVLSRLSPPCGATASPSRRKAFTLVELLVVVTIIVILLALLAPALDRAMEQAERAVCGGRQKAMFSVMYAYGMDHRRRLPASNLTAEGSWLHDMSFSLARKLFEYGAGSEAVNGAFYCHAEQGLLPKYWFGGSWSQGAGLLVIGWVMNMDRAGGGTWSGGTL